MVRALVMVCLAAILVAGVWAPALPAEEPITARSVALRSTELFDAALQYAPVVAVSADDATLAIPGAGADGGLTLASTGSAPAQQSDALWTLGVYALCAAAFAKFLGLLMRLGR